MKRLAFIVEQIHEAGRFLSLESAAHARMALLLLDNAAEILMHRTVMRKLDRDKFYSRIFESAKASLPPDKAADFIGKTGYTLIPGKLRSAMEGCFNPKVDFLVEQEKISEVLGQAVKALHRYRNDAYHRDKVRWATLHPAAVVYYEVVCELLVALPPSSLGYASTENWSDFQNKYGVAVHDLIGSDGLARVASKLRSAIGIDENSLARVLSRHLISRLEELNGQLDFICEYFGPEATHSDELKRIQFSKEADRLRGLSKNEIEQQFVAYTPKCTVKDLAEWRHRAELLQRRTGEGNTKLFREFCEIERELEPLEEAVNEVASLLDREIEYEIDRRRGK